MPWPRTPAPEDEVVRLCGDSSAAKSLSKRSSSASETSSRWRSAAVSSGAAAVRQRAKLSLTLSAPVVIWGALPFHRAAWANVKHATATMDTLISVGVLAAFAWSLYALFSGDAGMPSMTMGFELIPERGAGADEIYLEVATAVTVFILAAHRRPRTFPRVVARFVNDRGGPGRWRARWRADGRIVASWHFRVRPKFS